MSGEERNEIIILMFRARIKCHFFQADREDISEKELKLGPG